MEDIVLISNSVPKSGSTFLFSLQNQFLRSFSTEPLENGWEKFGIADGFVQAPHSEQFLRQITSPDLSGGPHTFKTHTLLNGRLRETILENENVYASLIIRDPVEIFLSAKDNYEKTSEFPEFSSYDSGVETINSYFKKIYESTVNTGYKKQIKLVRYESLRANPIQALSESLPDRIRETIMLKFLDSRVNIARANSFSKNRKNISQKSRKASKEQYPLLNELENDLSEIRALFGYT